MAIAEELDDDLEPEVRDEMQKYGQVNKVVIFKVCHIFFVIHNIRRLSGCYELRHPVFIYPNFLQLIFPDAKRTR
jgi:hypothetical protein